MSNSIKLIKNSFHLFMIKGFDLIVPLITLPFLLSKLKIGNYGKYAMALSLAYFIGSLVQYGYSMTGVRAIAIAENLEDKNKRFNEYFFSNLFLGAFVVCISCLLTILINKEVILYIGCFLNIIVFSIIPSWYFNGVEDFSKIAILNIIGKSIGLSFIFIFINDEVDYILVPYCLLFGNIFIFFSSLLVIIYGYEEKINIPKVINIINNIKSGFYAFLIQFFPNLYNNLSVYLVGLFLTPIYAGVLNSAMILVELFNSGIRIISTVIYPLFIKNKKLINIYSLALSVTLVGFLFFYNLILHYFGYLLIHDESVKEILKYFHFLSISCLFLLPYLIFIKNKHMVYKKDKELSKNTILISIFSCVISVMLIYLFQALGAILALILARLFLVLYGLFSMKKLGILYE